MNSREVVHHVLKISHVAEEVFGHFRRRLDDASWGKRWSADRVLRTTHRGPGRRWGGMTGKERRNEEEEKNDYER